MVAVADITFCSVMKIYLNYCDELYYFPCSVFRSRRTYSVSRLFSQVEFSVRFVGWSVGLSVCVCLSVGNDFKFWKNGQLGRDAVWNAESRESKKPCIRWGLTSSHGKKYFWGMGWRNVTCRRRGLLPSYYNFLCSHCFVVAVADVIFVLWLKLISLTVINYHVHAELIISYVIDSVCMQFFCRTMHLIGQ